MDKNCCSLQWETSSTKCCLLLQPWCCKLSCYFYFRVHISTTIPTTTSTTLFDLNKFPIKSITTNYHQKNLHVFVNFAFTYNEKEFLCVLMVEGAYKQGVLIMLCFSSQTSWKWIPNTFPFPKWKPFACHNFQLLFFCGIFYLREKKRKFLLHWENSCFSTSCDHHQEKVFAFEIFFFFISFFKTLIIKNQSTSLHFDHLSIFFFNFINNVAWVLDFFYKPPPRLLYYGLR